MRISDWSSDVCSSDLLVAEVIRRWLNDNGRWNSPKFLGGESYGTTRSAAVANQLMNETYNDVALNGIILISTVLDFAAGADTPGNELSPINNLPSMAATAPYHGQATAPSVEAFVEERSEGRRVGEEWGSKGRSRGWREH